MSSDQKLKTSPQTELLNNLVEALSAGKIGVKGFSAGYPRDVSLTIHPEGVLQFNWVGSEFRLYLG